MISLRFTFFVLFCFLLSRKAHQLAFFNQYYYSDSAHHNLIDNSNHYHYDHDNITWDEPEEA